MRNMTNQEAINYLQQLYPNGGHCWLDEQRIEAIGMAVKALQKEPVSEEWIEELRTKLDSMSKEEFEQVWGKYRVEEEEPVSEELEEAAEGYAVTDEVLPNGKVMINFQVEKAFKAGAKWQKEKDQSCPKDFIEIADSICAWCYYRNEKTCSTCPVRRTIDTMNKNSNKQ